MQEEPQPPPLSQGPGPHPGLDEPLYPDMKTFRVASLSAIRTVDHREIPKGEDNVVYAETLGWASGAGTFFVDDHRLPKPRGQWVKVKVCRRACNLWTGSICSTAETARPNLREQYTFGGPEGHRTLLPIAALVGFDAYNCQPASIRYPLRDAIDWSYREIDDLKGLQTKCNSSGQVRGSCILLVQDLAVPGDMAALKEFLRASRQHQIDEALRAVDLDKLTHL
ncbi:hypothetical protein HRG_010559 [Hirsutella rhossiliensis]|uniref:Uncharacterized protein n=1 Tax=Hirsutella rhossiliensis TaxID=111463 RepID=A0A9P8ML17_9HYPO|nr:uncharacterized protein HRG_10559 [Hirsutella rhossiliensis]KAH0958258.1 hypothetical protein HRG_10559 [Hirsutella rhossiliensis]